MRDYPCAIADQTDEGEIAALGWLAGRMQKGEELTLWVMQKNILDNNDFLRDLSRCEGRGLTIEVKGPLYQVNGPVLAMYPRVEYLAYVTSAVGITALAVVQWVDMLTTWVKEVNAEVLHTFEPEVGRPARHSSGSEPELVPEVVEGLEIITRSINHNNSIASSGFEKDVTVRELLRLHDAGLPLPPNRMAEWAIAHGWSRNNPKALIDWVSKINSGTRPRISRR